MKIIELNIVKFYEYSAVFIVISLLVIISYSDAIGFGILSWDSHKYIIENECIHGLGFSNINCIFSEIYFSNWHPLTSISYAIEYELFGDNPKIYHVTNIFLHISNCFLIYLIAKKVYIYNGISDQQLIVAAFISAILFAVHPQHVESVAWIAERKGLLSTLFFLFSILFYFDYVKNGNKKRKIKYFSLSVIAFILSLLSKSIAITMPVLLLLVDIFPLNRIDFSQSLKIVINKFKLLVVEKSPFIFFSVAMIFVTIFAQADGGAIISVDKIGFFTRIVNAIYSVFFYLGKWIIPFQLSPYYTFPEFLITEDKILIAINLISFLGVVVISIRYLILGNLLPAVIFSFILISLLPVIGIVKVGIFAAADRYTYIPLIPLYLLSGYYISKIVFLATFLKKLILICCISGLILVLVSISRAQVKIWNNDISLWSYVANGWIGSNTVPLVALADALFYGGDYVNALRFYSMANSGSSFPSLQTYVRFARSYSYTGKIDIALKIYRYLLDQPELEQEWKEIVESDIAATQKLKEKTN